MFFHRSEEWIHRILFIALNPRAMASNLLAMASNLDPQDLIYCFYKMFSLLRCSGVTPLPAISLRKTAGQEEKERSKDQMA